MTAVRTIRSAEWTEECVRACQPCLIADGLREWPAMRWSPAYLSSACADSRVILQVSHSGKWQSRLDGGPVDAATQYGMPNVSFDQATDWIVSRRHGHAYYLSQSDIKQFPGLVGNLRFDASRPRAMVNLWFGSAGTVTPLHHDGMHNLFGQVYGTKTVTLFDPADTPHLSPQSDGPMSHVSPVDIEAPDLGRHPTFPMATALTVHMEPGSLLFIPAFWWHHVRAHDTSISVNQWWRPPIDECRGPTAMRHWLGIYRRDGWCQYRAAYGVGRDELLSTAEGVRHSAPELAVLALNVALDDVAQWRGGQAWPPDDVTVTEVRAALAEVRENRSAAVTPERAERLLVAVQALLGQAEAVAG